MPSRFGPDGGSSRAWPGRSRRPLGVPSNRNSQFECMDVGVNPWSRSFWYEDFLASTLALPSKLRDTSSAGAPTFAQRADIANGVWRVTLASTNEAEVVGVDWEDQRMIPANKGWIFEAMVALPAALAANEFFLAGVIDDYNATVNSIALSAWFRINGAATPSLTLLIESDDNTTDSSTTTTAALTAATMAMLRIDATDLGAIKFQVNDQPIGTLSAPLMGATTLQPFIVLGKASGTTVPTLDIDSYHVSWNRV